MLYQIKIQQPYPDAGPATLLSCNVDDPGLQRVITWIDCAGWGDTSLVLSRPLSSARVLSGQALDDALRAIRLS